MKFITTSILLIILSLAISSYGQNIMVLSEENADDLRMMPCFIMDSTAIQDAELEILYRYSHCQVSDTTRFS